MKNNTEQIGQYLQNEMNAEEKTAFEKQLGYDKELQDELAIQQQILSAINTAGLKSKFGKAVRTKFISRMLVRWGIVAIVVGSLAFYALKTNMFSHSFDGESIRVPGTESYVIDNTKDTIIETDEGVVFGIPANAFGSDNKKVNLEIKTAISPEKIMQQGLSTTSNGQLLQTAGMFYINGFVNEKPVSLVKKIDVSVPAKNVNPKMQLFNGVQDSTGRINWVNPKPIINGLRTYDITTLDFYPTRYIPTLKALGKDYTNKKYTDSLYYSFSVNKYNFPEKDLTTYGGRIFYNKCASCHIMGRDATGPNLQGVLNRWDSKEHLKQWILNWKKAVNAGYPRAVEVQNFSPAQMQVFEGSVNDEELEALIKWINEWQPGNSAVADVLIDLPKTEQGEGRFDVATDTTNKPWVIKKDSTTNFHYEIDPSRIRAIWDPQFNNTILATKEFEERLHFLHELCTAEYFQGYLEMMDRPMYEIDQICADHSTGEIRKKFLEFAARKDGGVMLKEGMQEKLSAYFQKKLKAYRDAAEKTYAKKEEELARLASIADDKRREQATRDYIRHDKNFNEELCINLTDAYKQIGAEHSCNDTVPPLPPPTIYYNITIDTVGWKNLDMYVYDATTNRESMTYTDPETGKTATLTYKELNITIEDRAQYDNVFIYLLPDSLNSFQRIEEYGNEFKEKLNMLFKYDAIAIAYKGDKIFFYKQTSIQPGQYTFRLSSITETELKKILNSYSKEKSSDMLNEYEYRVFEQNEARREVELRKEQDFLWKVFTSIFHCAGEGMWDTIRRK